jgi:hypothetical protein
MRLQAYLRPGMSPDSPDDPGAFLLPGGLTSGHQWGLANLGSKDLKKFNQIFNEKTATWNNLCSLKTSS